MTDINNIKNYKPCRKKQTDYWMCIPPKGTVIVNRLGQFEVLNYLRSLIPEFRMRDYLTSVESDSIKSKNPQLYSFICSNCYVVSDAMNVVLCGTEGEMWGTSYSYVCENYLIYNNNSFVSISSVLQSRLVDFNNEKVLNWCKVTNKQSKDNYFACYVPKNESGSIITNLGSKLTYNEEGVSHGKGDFIVCESFSGKPNLQSRWVVNGLVFANTYDNRGWSDKITIGRMGIAEPHKLWTTSDTKVNSSSNIVNYLLSWYKAHNSKGFYNFVKTSNLSDDVLGNLRKMTKIADYIIQKYTKDFTPMDDEISLDGLDCSGFYFYYNNINVTFTYPDCLFYMIDDESYEYTCSNSRDVDDFFLSLKSSAYESLKAIVSSIDGLSELYKSICKLDERVIELLNKHTINSQEISKFLSILSKGFNKYGKKDSISFDYDWDNTLSISFLLKDNDLCVTFNIDITDSSSIFAFAYNENDDYIEYYVPYNNYNVLIDFLNDVYNNKFEKDEALEVREVDLPRNTLAFYGDKLYFSSNKTKYASVLGNLGSDILRICKILDSDCNFTDCIELSSEINTGVSTIEPNEFLNIIFRELDKGVKFCLYNRKIDFNIMRNIDIASFEVVYISNVKRVYGNIVYEGGIKLPVNISKSTLKLLKYENSYKVYENISSTKPSGNFTTLHYFQLMLRMGLMRYLYNVKNLKLLYVDYAYNIFEDLLPRNLVVSVGNYDKVINSTLEENTLAHHIPSENIIVFNGKYISLQSDLSKYAKSTIIHEMCHSYVNAKFGTSRELPNEDGGTYLHLSERYKSQWFCHGKRFSEAVKMASEKTNIPYNDIFGYGIGHTKLTRDTPDRDVFTLGSKNAFNFGQSYRKFRLADFNDVQICKKHGITNCSCIDGEKITVDAGRYIGICRQCGKLHIFDDSSIASQSDISLDYFDVIDRVGLVATSKCENCGTRLSPIITEIGNNKEQLSDYIKDLQFSDRFITHMLDVCSSNKQKYETYFIRNYNCNLELSRGRMPYLCIDITNGDEFKEMYKFFISCSVSHKPVGRLYRDYDLSMKGRLIHNFRINTDKDILKFFEYLMSYIRNDLRSI